MIDEPRYMRWHGNLGYGHWMIRLFGLFFHLKAPWCQPLFSERYRYGVTVIPLFKGWRITIRKVGT